jgi:glutamate/tyrosine decarboxylase-like PLP-dependent enzyme
VRPTSINLIRTIATFGVQYWLYAQIDALGRKGRAEPSMSVFSATINTMSLQKNLLAGRKQDRKLQTIRADINKDDGYEPLMIVATTGTTGSGAIDPVKTLAQIAARHNCWIHADAAYGGAVVLTEKYKHLLEGIEQADSITFDAHKWLSVPMATSMFLTRHKHILGQTFRIRTDYMPSDDNEIQELGSFGHSIQWSRRFIGLKLYLPLLVFG